MLAPQPAHDSAAFRVSLLKGASPCTGVRPHDTLDRDRLLEGIP